MRSLLKPKKLKTGDTIALVSPSAPLANMVPERVSTAIKNLELLGLNVITSPNALLRNSYTAGTAEQRAQDIMDVFVDDGVSAIMSFIGGFHSNQILEHLDFDKIRENNKIFIGFSDITVLHMAFYTQSGIVSYYGPAALPQFGEPYGVDKYTINSFKKVLFDSSPIGEIAPSKQWTDEFLDWFSQKDQERPRATKSNIGYEWLKPGIAEGVLLGGCLTSLLHLRGTGFWPDFSDALFFCETPESSCDITKGESVAHIDTHLTDLVLNGTFKNCQGVIWGRPKGLTAEQTQELKQVILRNLKKYDFPILFGCDFGHTDPMITIPIGIKARISSENNKFEILESGSN